MAKIFNWRKQVIKYLLSISGSKAWEVFEYMKKTEKLPSSTLESIQKSRLRKIILHSYSQVPYYRDLLKKYNVVNNNHTVHLGNFCKLPILTKDIIRKEGTRLYSKDHKRRNSYINTSGGSTGEPVIFLQDSHHRDYCVIANKFYANYLAGKDVGEKEINIWGSLRDINRNSKGLKENFQNWLYNRVYLNASVINEKRLRFFADKINSFRPRSIWTYTVSIDELAKFIEKRHIKIFSPKVIMTTAGVLYPEARSRIERVFRCPVLSLYGSCEIGAAAIECSRKLGFHGFPWSNFFELIDSKIVVTTLTNYSMPFLRYEIGDTAVPVETEKCSCTRNTLVFKSITGRISDHLTATNGNSIFSGIITRIFYNKNWVKKFQVRQKNKNEISCLIVPNGQIDKLSQKEITKAMRSVLGSDMQIKWTFCDNLPPSKSGKYRYIINETKESKSA